MAQTGFLRYLTPFTLRITAAPGHCRTRHKINNRHPKQHIVPQRIGQTFALTFGL
jgi:hypothetical protein